MSSPPKDRWGKRLAETRVALGLSETELAKRWKPLAEKRDETEIKSLTRSIKRYESGKTARPRYSSDISELAAALGVDARWLETGVPAQSGLPEVLDFLRRHPEIKPDVAAWMRTQTAEAFGSLRMWPPTEEDLGEMAFEVERMVRHRRKHPDGDQSS